LRVAQSRQIGLDAVEVGLHLPDLGVERRALRRLTAEQDEEAVALTAHSPRGRTLAVELGLLAVGGFLVAANLFVACWIPTATVECRKLRLKPGASRVLLRINRQDSRDRDGGRRQDAAKSKNHQIPIPRRDSAASPGHL
jgi:hypothetical protein